MKKALVLFAHGSRNSQWRQPFDALVQRLEQRMLGVRVALSFLELQEPSLESVVADCVAAGVTYIRIAPIFFGVGKHVREDLPHMVEQLRAAHPAVTLDVSATLGEDDAMLDAIAGRLVDRFDITNLV